MAIEPCRDVRDEQESSFTQYSRALSRLENEFLIQILLLSRRASLLGVFIPEVSGLFTDVSRLLRKAFLDKSSLIEELVVECRALD